MNTYSLFSSLVYREIVGRYRGSLLGIFWSLLTPLFMLAVYTLVFGSVFQMRWRGIGESGATPEFAIVLFSGLLIFQLFAEVVNGAPGLIVSNVSYVKKVVFPLWILVPVALVTALFHTVVSLTVLLVFNLLVNGTLHWTLLLLPIVLVPLCLVVLGIGWILASLGVYLRDINQFIGTVVTALLFLSPIFFPLSALPDWLRPFVIFNPVAIPVEAVRDLVIWGQIPDLVTLGIYALAGIVIALAGYFWFRATYKGFADVL